MSVMRPPCAVGKRPAAPAFIALFLLAAAGIGAGELNLPELYIPKRARQDIPQPWPTLGIDTDWIAELPRFRRIYPISPAIPPLGFYPEPDSFGVPLGALAVFDGKRRFAVLNTGVRGPAEPIMEGRGRNLGPGLPPIPGDSAVESTMRPCDVSLWRS